MKLRNDTKCLFVVNMNSRNDVRWLRILMQFFLLEVVNNRDYWSASHLLDDDKINWLFDDCIFPLLNLLLTQDRRQHDWKLQEYQCQIMWRIKILYVLFPWRQRLDDNVFNRTFPGKFRPAQLKSKKYTSFIIYPIYTVSGYQLTFLFFSGGRCNTWKSCTPFSSNESWHDSALTMKSNGWLWNGFQTRNITMHIRRLLPQPMKDEWLLHHCVYEQIFRFFV